MYLEVGCETSLNKNKTTATGNGKKAEASHKCKKGPVFEILHVK